jgi:hypothetical protein
MPKPIANLILWFVSVGILFAVWTFTKGDLLWCSVTLIGLCALSYLWERMQKKKAGGG